MNASPTTDANEDAAAAKVYERRWWILGVLVLSLVLVMAANATSKGALVAGLFVFGTMSLLATFADDPGTLIAIRAVQGLSAAFIMPGTLSILAAVFPPEERAKAIGLWAGFAGSGSRRSASSSAGGCSRTTGGGRCSSSMCRSPRWPSCSSSCSSRRHVIRAACRSTGAARCCRWSPSAPCCSGSSRVPNEGGRPLPRSPASPSP